MIDPISIGIMAGAAITLALILKSWARESGALRLEIAKIDAQRKGDDMADDLDHAIKDAEEARRLAAEAAETSRLMSSRLSAVENRTRRG